MLSLWIVAPIVVLVVLLRYAFKALGQPLAYRHELLGEVGRFLEVFLHQAGVGSVFVLTRESGPGFLQLALISHRGDKEQLEFGLPDTDWCAHRFDAVREALEGEALLVHVQEDSRNAAVPRFLRVRIQGNRQELVPTLMHVLSLAAQQLEFDAHDRYTLRMNATTSPEYSQYLAGRVVETSGKNWVGRMLAALIRSSSRRPRS